MLDPFTSLSLAGAVVQFVDFASKVVKTAKDIHEAGSDIESRRLKVQAADLKQKSQYLDKRQRLLQALPEGADDVDDFNDVNDIRKKAASQPVTDPLGLYQTKKQLQAKKAKRDLSHVNEALQVGEDARRRGLAELDNKEIDLRFEYLFTLNGNLKKREKPGLIRARDLAEGEEVSYFYVLEILHLVTGYLF